MMLVIKTHWLQRFLDGTVVAPLTTVLDSAGSSIVNPAFVQFKQQDAAISAWLLSTVSPALHN